MEKNLDWQLEGCSVDFPHYVNNEDRDLFKTSPLLEGK